MVQVTTAFPSLPLSLYSIVWEPFSFPKSLLQSGPKFSLSDDSSSRKIILGALLRV